MNKRQPTGALFLLLRKKLNLTQMELAEKIGFTSKVFISKVETGVYLPSEKYIHYMVSQFPRKKRAIELTFMTEKIKRSISGKYFPKQLKNEANKTAT